jgi:urease accessory protein
MTASTKYQHNLELALKYYQEQTICQHQYTSYPLRLSSAFRLEGINTNRVYLYLINTSPGLLANDALNLSLNLAENTSLYLTDQSATKVHPMPESKTKATVNYQIEVGKNANLEYIPEPVILYQDSILEQNIQIKLHRTAKLFLREIILPGRLAKNEYYDFNYYFNRLQIVDWTDKLMYIDAMRLSGKKNPFKSNKLFASLPIIANAIAILPELNLDLLIAEIQNQKNSIAKIEQLETAITILPAENGIAIRALGNKTSQLKQYFDIILNCIRAMTKQAKLPYIPK